MKLVQPAKCRICQEESATNDVLIDERGDAAELPQAPLTCPRCRATAVQEVDCTSWLKSVARTWQTASKELLQRMTRSKTAKVGRHGSRCRCCARRRSTRPWQRRDSKRLEFSRHKTALGGHEAEKLQEVKKLDRVTDTSSADGSGRFHRDLGELEATLRSSVKRVVQERLHAVLILAFAGRMTSSTLKGLPCQAQSSGVVPDCNADVQDRS